MSANEDDKRRLITTLTKELKEENLAVFIGAGLSSPAGFVSWSGLLAPIADELKLNIDREVDLVSLAQYYINENAGNRGRLNQLLIDEFCRKAEVTENHKILARLPISTYWTTNYDKLIEQALTEARKVPDVKYNMKQLVYTKPRRNALVYKMHGDVDHPHEAVLVKDDYERYHVERQPFVDALRGDLISKTFLFLGFSFTDPNLDYILSRVRVAYSKDQRQHYCLLKAVRQEQGEDRADFEYRQRKQELFVQDLRRVGIKSLLINDYSEVTDILRGIEEQFRRNTVFISGAAHDYSPFEEEDISQFVYDLSRDIVRAELKVVSGFGLGIGSSVIAGALNQIYMTGHSLADEQLIMRPFPQSQPGEETMAELWTKYRQDMISHAGIAIFICGNKLEAGAVVPSGGMREEFEIAKKMGLFLLPVGATGYIAKEIWDEVNDTFWDLYPGMDDRVFECLRRLGDASTPLSQLRTDVMTILTILTA